MNRREILLSIGGIAALSGCSEKSSNSNTGSTEREDTRTPEPTTDTGIKKIDIGKSHTTETNFSISVTKIEIANEVKLDTGTYEASPENVLVLAHIYTENDGNSPKEPPGSIALLSEKSQYRPISPGYDTIDVVTEPVSGNYYKSEDTIHPGIVVEGWTIFEIPRDVSSITIAISEYDVFQHIDSVYWQGSIDTKSIANVKFSEINAPEEVTLGSTVDVEFVANNQGMEKGEFNRTIQYNLSSMRRPNDQRISFEVPGESTATKTVNFEADSIGNTTVTYGDTTKRIQVQPASVSEGIPFKFPSGLEIIVDNLKMSSWYEYEQYDGPTRVTAPVNHRYAFGNITLKNPTNDSVSTPPKEAFFAAGPDSVNPITSGENFGTTVFTDPVVGEEFIGGGYGLSAGSTTTGWAIFEVPSGLETSDVDIGVSWNFDYNSKAVVYWE